MSRPHQSHIPSPQPSSKTFIASQKHDITSTAKSPEYCSYFYRNSIQGSNPSPSPSSSNTNTITISKSKQSKKMKATRLLCKGITENPHSNQYPIPSRKNMEEQFMWLKKENEQLRNEIIELKVNQFYQFDNNKLKDLILEVEKLKAEIAKLKEENEGLKIQNDFLNRTNFQLKTEKITDNDLRKPHKDSTQQTRIHHQISKDSQKTHECQIPTISSQIKQSSQRHQKTLQKVQQHGRSKNKHSEEKALKNIQRYGRMIGRQEERKQI